MVALLYSFQTSVFHVVLHIQLAHTLVADSKVLDWQSAIYSSIDILTLFCSSLKVILSTLAFTAFELPPNGAIGTRILEFLFHSRPDLVRILFSLVISACVLFANKVMTHKIQLYN